MRHYTLTSLALILSALLLAACIGEPPTPLPRTPTPAPTVVSIPTAAAVTFDKGTVLDSTKEQPANETPPVANQVDFSGNFLVLLSHDQKSIAVLNGNTMCKYEADALALRWCTSNPVSKSPLTGTTVWSQDDSLILSSVFNKVLLFNATNGHVQTIDAPVDMTGSAITSISMDTCGNTYLVTFDSGMVGILNVETGEYDQTAQLSEVAVFAASWLRCGERIMATARDRTLIIRDLKIDRDLYRIEKLETIPDWSPDRSAFVIGIDRQVAIVTPGQDEPSVRSLAVSGSALGWVTWSPDGRMIAAANQDSATIWDVSSGKALYHLPVQAGVIFSADGARIATVEKGGLMTIWDLSTGKMLYRLSDSQHILFRKDNPDRVLIIQPVSLVTRDLK